MASKKVNESAAALAKKEYERLIESDLEDVKRDKNGFLILEHSADMVDRQSESLTSSIESLEDKLRKYKEEKKRYDEIKKTPEYKEEVSKKKSRKKRKKERQNLLEMIFDNTDELRASIDENMEEDDEENYKDSTKTKRAAAKANKKTNTLDSTYGTRYAPIISTYYDMMNDIDDTIDDIKSELKTRQGSQRGVYRSSQTGNMISAINVKFSVAKQIETVANKITDMEYKKSKDQKGDESDTTRSLTLLGAQYLRGSYRGDTGPAKKKKPEPSKKDDKQKKKKKDSDEDDMIESIHIKEGGPSKSDREQAADFAKMLLSHRKDIQLDPHEYHINMEGKYKFIVVADSKNPGDTWEFVAVDPETNKKIKGFKENYKDLYPKRKLCRMSFDMEKMKATDKNSNKSYQLILK